jgi:hypothetical protein
LGFNGEHHHSDLVLTCKLRNPCLEWYVNLHCLRPSTPTRADYLGIVFEILLPRHVSEYGL